MPTSRPTAEVLTSLGFVDIGKWQPKDGFIEYILDGRDFEANTVRLDDPSALYAFVINDRVQYIGKTARSIRRRFVGYRRPGGTQVTNRRCHHNVKIAMADGSEVRIYVFTPVTHLQYGDFEIDIAAGLEESLIKAFAPLWNVLERKQPITEEAEREKHDEGENGVIEPEVDNPRPPIATFPIVLAATYYNKGYINPGSAASKVLGKDGDPVRIRQRRLPDRDFEDQQNCKYERCRAHSWAKFRHCSLVPEAFCARR